MVNYLNSKNWIQNFQNIQKISSIQGLSNNHNNINKLTYTMFAFSMKALTSQIKAMAEQDKKIPIGEILNVIV